MMNLTPKHGGYRRLKSFQVARLIYDITIRFCNRFISSRSRTHDQMVQAARSGVQNIAEGSQASGTSKKTELKLTNVARASLEELRLDYEDFLRQRQLPVWEWVKAVHQRTQISVPEIAANAVLTLLTVACKLLDRQLAVQAETFQREGGFTERLYRVRTATRNQHKQ